MEGLIVIVLVFWLMNSLAKTKKKPAKPAIPAQPAVPAQPAAQLEAAQTTMLGDPVEIMRPERMIPEPMISESMAVEAPARSGSLPGRSMEGVDPCHPRAERRMEHRLKPHPEAREMYPSQEQGEELVPEITPENMRQAFVMSEILTRPCERRRYP